MADDKRSSDQRWLDDQLAEYTDRLLGSDPVEVLRSTARDPELRTLQEAVFNLKQEFDNQEPSAAMRARIRANLVTKWHEVYPTDADTEDNTVSRRRRFLPSRWPAGRKISRARLAYALLGLVAGVAIVLLISQLAGVPDDGSLVGAAISETQRLPLVLLVGVLLTGILWWVSRHKQ